MAEKPTYWQWRVRLKPGAFSPWFSTKNWKLLRWRMTDDDAAKWGTENDCEMQRVEGSAHDLGGHYLGWSGPSAPMCCIPEESDMARSKSEGK